MEQLKAILTNDNCSIYQIPGSTTMQIRRFVVSTPETRQICNDPFCVGVRYTSLLQHACAKMFSGLFAKGGFTASQHEAVVLHILRGGLNFGIRDALHEALGWNYHSSAFISAQRARSSENPEDWYITENAYSKVFLPRVASIIFGDVVATGTSLHYALRQLLATADKQQVELRSIWFVTIGGVRAEEILMEVDRVCREKSSGYAGSSIIYIEGRFDIARPESRLSIKHTGTDLLRSNALLAPEFLESQYDQPSCPIERCTIYDAGSRAFWLEEYFNDLKDYWEKTLALAQKGMTYKQLLDERCPEVDARRFGRVSLESVCREQLKKCPEEEDR